MIQLPPNVDRVRDQTMTLRFVSNEECGYKMLYEAGAARLAQRMLSFDYDAEDAYEDDDLEHDGDDVEAPATNPALEAEKNAAITAFNASRFKDGEGKYCIVLSVGDAISLVSGIESIRNLSRKGVSVTAHNFTPPEVVQACTEMLKRFEHSIAQVMSASAAVSNPEGLGVFLPASEPAPGGASPLPAAEEPSMDGPAP